MDFVHKIRRIRTCEAQLSILSYKSFEYPVDSLAPFLEESEGEVFFFLTFLLLSID